MGPPLRSFAADAHDCIMVRVLGPTGYKVVARLNRARSGLPSDRYPDRVSVPSPSKPLRQRRSMPQGWCNGQPWPRGDQGEVRVGRKKRSLRSNTKT